MRRMCFVGRDGRELWVNSPDIEQAKSELRRRRRRGFTLEYEGELVPVKLHREPDGVPFKSKAACQPLPKGADAKRPAIEAGDLEGGLDVSSVILEVADEVEGVDTSEEVGVG